jgi:hypothetical protein
MHSLFAAQSSREPRRAQTRKLANSSGGTPPCSASSHTVYPLRLVSCGHLPDPPSQYGCTPTDLSGVGAPRLARHSNRCGGGITVRGAAGGGTRRQSWQWQPPRWLKHHETSDPSTAEDRADTACSSRLDSALCGSEPGFRFLSEFWVRRSILLCRNWVHVTEASL